MTAFIREVSELSAALALEGFPIEGESAVKLWELSNRSSVPADLAIRIMQSLGYVPLVGYPLQRQSGTCWKGGR